MNVSQMNVIVAITIIALSGVSFTGMANAASPSVSDGSFDETFTLELPHAQTKVERFTDSVISAVQVNDIKIDSSTTSIKVSIIFPGAGIDPDISDDTELAKVTLTNNGKTLTEIFTKGDMGDSSHKITDTFWFDNGKLGNLEEGTLSVKVTGNKPLAFTERATYYTNQPIVFDCQGGEHTINVINDVVTGDVTNPLVYTPTEPSNNYIHRCEIVDEYSTDSFFKVVDRPTTPDTTTPDTTTPDTTTPDTTTPEPKKKKSGGGSNDWKVKPTFGKSWETNSREWIYI